jgi:hypothetical protein
MKLLRVVLLCLPICAQEPATKPAQPEVAAAPAAPAAPAESSVPSTENWLSGSVELGYRWLPSISGSLNTYRSVVNLGEGPKLFGADFTLLDPRHRLFDRADVHTTSWGGEPSNSTRVDIRRAGLYRFSLDYRNIAYFNFLPSYANPGLSAGSLLDQNSFDTRLRTTDVQLDLLPNRKISPYLAFSRNTQFGSGVSVFYSDQNQYPVASLFSNQSNNYRAGANIDLGKIHLSLEQGGTTFKDDQGESNTQLNPGNLTTAFLGRRLTLNNLGLLYRVRGDSIYSKALVAANPTTWLTISGDFVFAEPTTTTRFSDAAAGNLYLASLATFYTSGQELLTGNATAPHTSGSLNLEIRPLPRLRILNYWMTDRLHNATDALLAQTILAGATPQSLSELSTDRLAVNYSQEEVDLLYDLTSYLTLRGGYRYVWGDSQVRGPRLLGVPFEYGNLSRNVGIGGVTFRLRQKLRASGDFEASSSDQAYFRTSLRNYQKARARASYDLSPAWRFSLNWSLLNNSDPDPQIRNSLATRATSASLFWMPKGGKNLSVLLDYTRASFHSDILYLIPQMLSPAFSDYRDNSHTGTALVTIRWFTAGGSFFKSSGSRPTQYYQPLARVSVPLSKQIHWNAEWKWYGFSERFSSVEGFRSHQFMTSLRFSRN